MKLNDLMDCAAPLLAEHPEDHEHPYWFGGTCFRVRYRGSLHIVTAAHCLKDKTKDHVRVQRRPESRSFLTLTTMHTQWADALDPDDHEKDDWAIFQAVEPEEDHEDPLGGVLDLDAVPLDSPSTPPPHKLVVRGYPKAISHIDYHRHTIHWKAFAGSGTYAGKTSWSAHCHTMQLDDVRHLESLDGLSGSPIFVVERDGSSTKTSLAGLALRGSKESALLHFLDARVVAKALHHVHATRAE